MPAKPRSPYHEDSPLTNAPRSMPAQKKPPAPVSTPTDSESSRSSSSSAPAMPAATAALTALRTSGRSIVINRRLSRRSVNTAWESLMWDILCRSASHPLAPVAYRQPPPTPPACSRGEQRQVGLAFAAQHLDVDLDAIDSARLREHARLRLDPLRDEHAPTGRERRVEADALEVARELLDGLHRGDALDLDGDPLVLGVATHQVDRADVGGPLAAHEPKTLATPFGRIGEQLLQFALEAFLLERGDDVDLVLDVGEHLGDRDLHALVVALLAHDETGQRTVARTALLFEHGWRRHPVERFDVRAATVGPDHERAVGLQHQQTYRLRQNGVGATYVG